jgi:glutamate 5-kinase
MNSGDMNSGDASPEYASSTYASSTYASSAYASPGAMRSIVVKIGSSSVTRATGPDPVVLTAALDAALTARALGWNVVLVSSGAVSSGSAYLARTSELDCSARLAAAVGQPFLMDIYRSVADVSGRHVCQLLISESDLRSPRAMSSVCAVLGECQAAGIIPIVNGNDVTDTRGSDNDGIAVGLAVASGADRLLLLTDVPGVLGDVRKDGSYLPDLAAADIRHIPTGRVGTGRGGMRSKLRAAELAAYNGIETHIAGARQPGVITACVKGEPVGTRIKPARERFPADSRWISGVATSHGSIVINRPAEDSIRSGASLFASGIKKVEGQFGRGDVIDVVTPAGLLVARGVSKVSASLMGLIRAMQTDDIALVLTEILGKFGAGADASAGAGAGAEADASAVPDSPAARPAAAHAPVVKALDLVHHHGYEMTRSLALEVMNLFPAATAEAMLGASQDQGLTQLRHRYSRLSSDLSFIDRQRLVVY